MLWIVLLALAGALLVYSALLLVIPVSDRETVAGRIEKYMGTSNLDEIQEQVFREKLEKAQKERRSSPRLASKELADFLGMAGVKLSATEFLYGWLGVTFLPPALILILRGNPVTALAFGIVGFILPPFLVERSRKKRQQEFNRQLGEALVVIGNSLKAGFTFQQAMEGVAKDMQPPLSTEFAVAIREMHYGVSFSDALRHMVKRVKNPDLELMVSAVLTSAQVGGNLVDILDVISLTIRDRIRIKQEIRVLTAQGRMSGLIIGLLPVFIILALMVINPAYFTDFFASRIGRIMLLISVVMEGIGFFIINKIVDIEY